MDPWLAYGYRAACWCHCGLCRKATGAAMQLGIFENFAVLQGDDTLIKYENNKGSGVIRNHCSKCGSFCYKILGDGSKVAPLGTLDPVVKPTCHIMVAHRGNQEIMFPELTQYDEFP